MNGKRLIFLLILGAFLSYGFDCSNNKKSNNNQSGNEIEWWLTKSDQSAKLQKQAAGLSFGDRPALYPAIEIDSAKVFQTVDGFGYALTGGSAYLINKLPPSQKSAILEELFGKNENSISISYLRISIGASDLSTRVFTYDDMPAGQTDTSLSNFSLSEDSIDLVPILKEILSINPAIKILGSPWSPPAWMKDNGSSIGGTLQPKYYGVYARYFVKYIEAMAANGITINAVTPQNEPQHGGNNPSMVLSAGQEADFIKNHLGPAFHDAGISTKIIIWDHNCDNPNYPISILNDADAKKYVDGSAFHLYNGDISALSTVHTLHPDKNLYFTEQWTGARESFENNLRWHMRNVIIGSIRNWSKIVLEWNLANDGKYDPHTPGGCSECKGALTLDGAINRNVSYYIVAHVSKFVPPGSMVISSNIPGDGLPNVAFRTPQGKKVLVVLNDKNTAVDFNIGYNTQTAHANMPALSAATFVF